MPEQRFIVRRRPGSYPLNPQQALMREANETCGIRKGISRAELVKQMRECIPQFYRQKREESASSSG